MIIMILQYIYWDIDPALLHISNFEIRWYGLLFALSFLCSFSILKRIYSKEGLSVKVLDAQFNYVLIGVVLGARLGHVFFYGPYFTADNTGYLDNPLNILKIWEGGLASHGAVIGIYTAMFLFCRKFKLSLTSMLDRLVIVIALSASFVRLGNFFNHEIVGDITDVPWGVVFKYVDAYPRHPAQLYESISYFLLFLFLSYLYVKTEYIKRRGFLLGVFFVVTFAARFLIEFVKEEQGGIDSMNTVLNVGQILSLPVIVLGMYFLITSRNKVSSL